MEGNNSMTSHDEQEYWVPGQWPPPKASRAIRRHCQHAFKAGYCVLCGAKTDG